MGYSDEIGSCSTLSNKKKIIALEATLQQSLSQLKDILLDFEQLEKESQNSKILFSNLQEKCVSKVCAGSESLKKLIQTKDNIIQAVGSALTKFNESRDENILNKAFKILFGETAILTPPKEKQDTELITPKKELSTSITEESHEVSLSEIDATPGRTSPIIFSKKFRHAPASDHREKKKCPTSWPAPESKTVRLTFNTPSKGKPGGKMKQARFTLVKQTSLVDLTSSPEMARSPSRPQEANSVQLNIKKEQHVDDEDVIQPSPTSLNSDFLTMFKTKARNSPAKNSPKKITKNSPAKFNKRPLTKLQLKTENISTTNIENECKLEDINQMEDSINLMRPNRFLTPAKTPVKTPVKDPNETDCEIDSSMSLLPGFQKLEKVTPEKKGIFNSPTKQPLLENINYTNLQMQCEMESSVPMSIPKQIINVTHVAPYKAKPKEFQPEALFKEPTVRKKAEKWALPGWSCDECKNFYAELYKDNPEMLAKKMDECSKHRGRNNPIRPKTPPGFWNPRWDVPEDTEEFNRRNNAV